MCKLLSGIYYLVIILIIKKKPKPAFRPNNSCSTFCLYRFSLGRSKCLHFLVCSPPSWKKSAPRCFLWYRTFLSSYIHINIINLADTFIQSSPGKTIHVSATSLVHMFRLCVHEMVNLKICFGDACFCLKQGFGFVFSALMLFLCFHYDREAMSHRSCQKPLTLNTK